MKATGAYVAGGFYIARVRSAKLTTAASVAFAAVACFFAYSAPVAGAAVCGTPVPYPGDNAPAPAIANWMSNGSLALNMPGELPVMAALVESGMKNLNYGDADSVGYFQMRTSFWNKGDYAGYPTNPDLQLKWFTDQAAKVRLQRTTTGKPDPASAETMFGEWIADVERPAEQYRGRYQLRLAEARALIAQTCPTAQSPDLAPPKYSARTAKKQHPLRTKAITTQILCPSEACNVGTSASISLAGRKRSVKVTSDTVMLGPGRRKTIKLDLTKSVRRTISNSLGYGRAYARLRLRIADVHNVAVVKVVKIRLLR